jgi:hypothetical protein
MHKGQRLPVGSTDAIVEIESTRLMGGMAPVSRGVSDDVHPGLVGITSRRIIAIRTPDMQKNGIE